MIFKNNSINTLVEFDDILNDYNILEEIYNSLYVPFKFIVY